MLEKEIIAANLDTLFEESPVKQLAADDKIVIFSDLHMGDGSKRDDFLHNAALFSYVLENQYLKQNYTLILNGDIEELQRFSYDRIFQQWKSVYSLFDGFAARRALFKIIGNHDYSLILKTSKSSPYKHLNSLVLNHKNNHLFIFHGHQASLYYTKHNQLIEFALRYIANPLGIQNYSVAHNSRKQFKIEKRVYNYSSSRKVASIIGHTHRPLFESLSKKDFLEYEIERMIRNFAKEPATATAEKEKKLLAYRDELIRIKQKEKQSRSLLGYSLYNEHMLIPCLFNSGCVIGSRGITCIEIVNQHIALVHYFDKRIKSVSVEDGKQPEQLSDTDYYRVVINQEQLDYIFTRIKFLS